MPVIVRPTPDLDTALRPYFDVPGSPRNAYFSGTPSAPVTEPASTEPADVAVLEIKAKANSETTTLEAVGVSVQWAGDDDLDNLQTEVSRTTRTVRVTNPEDPEQYVDIELTDEMSLQTAKGVLKQWVFKNNS